MQTSDEPFCNVNLLIIKGYNEARGYINKRIDKLNHTINLLNELLGLDINEFSKYIKCVHGDIFSIIELKEEFEYFSSLEEVSEQIKRLTVYRNILINERDNEIEFRNTRVMCYKNIDKFI